MAWSGPSPGRRCGRDTARVKCLHAHYAWFLVGGDDPVGRWVAEQLAGGTATATPASAGERWVTSPRWLRDVVDPSADQTPSRQPVVRLMRVTGLGQGVDQARALHPEAVERAPSVLRGYPGINGPTWGQRVRMVGTSALRDAANRAAFSNAAEEIIGAPLSLLSGQEEAALSFAGATAELNTQDGPWLVADIGGGSTELIVGPEPSGLVRSTSAACG